MVGLLDWIGCLSALDCSIGLGLLEWFGYLSCCLLLEKLNLEVGKISSPHSFDFILVCVKSDGCDVSYLILC